MTETTTATDPDMDRIARERDFHNARFAHEHRDSQHKFYFAVESIFERYRSRLAALSRGADVLEYGCSFGDVGRSLAPQAKSVHGIDVSDVAIDEANRGAAELATSADAAPCTFEVMDAHAMDYPDDSFDLVFGSGIIHHLAIEAALTEVARVLRPGGRCVFIEPLGANPMFNLYRKLTPRARTADEMPLRARHLRAFNASFAATKFDFAGLTSLASVPLRGTAAGPISRAILEKLDSALFAIPGVDRLAWFVILEGTKADR